MQLVCPSCGTKNRVPEERLSDGPVCGRCGDSLAVAEPVALDERTFEKFVSGTDVPVVVDFWADWCGPCKMMAPHVDELAARHEGRALVAKLNTDNAPMTAERFQIRGIPTVIVFRDGREARRQSGAMPLPALRAMLA